MNASTTAAHREPHRLLVAGAIVLATITTPIAQLAIYGALAAYVAFAAHAGTWITVTCWATVAASGGAILHLVMTNREPGDAMLPTNASAIVLGLVQMVVLASIWLLFTPDSLVAKGFIGLFAGLTAFDIVDRILFVVRMRRQGGVEAEARRIVERIMSGHPEDAHGLIAEENVKRRGRSRLHWRLGEALSAENVALYEREAEQRQAEASAQ